MFNYQTYHLSISCNRGKKEKIQQLIKESIEIANLYFKAIKDHKTTNSTFLHELLYQYCRQKYPKFPSSTIQQIQRDVISRIEINPKLLKKERIHTHFFLPFHNHTIYGKPKSYFQGWIKIQKTLYPLEGLDIIQKLKQLQLLNHEVNSNNQIEKVATIHHLKISQKTGSVDCLKKHPTQKIHQMFIRMCKNDTLRLSIVIKTPKPRKHKHPTIDIQTDFSNPECVQIESKKVTVSIPYKIPVSPVKVLQVRNTDRKDQGYLRKPGIIEWLLSGHANVAAMLENYYIPPGICRMTYHYT